jgi:hypothetical protein
MCARGQGPSPDWVVAVKSIHSRGGARLLNYRLHLPGCQGNLLGREVDCEHRAIGRVKFQSNSPQSPSVAHLGTLLGHDGLTGPGT